MKLVNSVVPFQNYSLPEISSICNGGVLCEAGCIGRCKEKSSLKPYQILRFLMGKSWMI